MREVVTFIVTKEFKKALSEYCKDNDLTMSTFVKGLVTNELTKKKYFKKKIGGK